MYKAEITVVGMYKAKSTVEGMYKAEIARGGISKATKPLLILLGSNVVLCM